VLVLDVARPHHWSSVPTRTPTEPDRYEPLPGIAALPGWIWRKLGGRIRLVAVAALLVTAAALTPAILGSSEDGSDSELRERAERRAQLARALRVEQRPRFRRSGSVAPPGAAAERQLEARAGLMDELPAAILADARLRVRRGALDGPIRRVQCEPHPRTVEGVGADSDLSRRSGSYSCIAVTAEFGRTEESIGGVIGHRYRARVDFESGRYAFCKIAGQAGPSREQLATTPEACGGR
jgi:hypothetical protein